MKFSLGVSPDVTHDGEAMRRVTDSREKVRATELLSRIRVFPARRTCARFVVRASRMDAGDGTVVNAGFGWDIAVKDLASLIADPARGGHGVGVRHVEHDHPQAEIPKLLCDNTAAARVYGWRPEVSLEEGIRRTREWIAANPGAI